jgi:hypothetical protein
VVLGGQLPIVSTSEEFEFLANIVIKEKFKGAVFKTWMGLQKSCRLCDHCLDGSFLNMTIQYYERCEACSHDCCAMFMWNDADFKKMSFTQYDDNTRMVCRR